MKVKLAISLLLAFLAFIFISQNTETVSVDFLAWSVEMSLVVLVFIILGTGIIIGWLLNSYLRLVRNRKQIKTREPMQTNVIAKQEEQSSAVQGDKEVNE
jgi:uncharacterized integral membrane protein